MQKITIQLIGLPCSGKSTFIKSYVDTRKEISYIDIRDYEKYNSKSRDRIFKKDLKKARGKIICESACGVHLKNSEVVKLSIPIDEIYKRHIKREGYLDEEYISLLQSEMIPSKYTVSDTESLEKVMDKLFNIG